MKWTSQEKEYLINNYSNTLKDTILQNIKGRNWLAIQAYAKKLKLKRSIIERPKPVNGGNKIHTNLIDKKFGKLTVISFSGFVISKRKNRSDETIREWNCICDCGSGKIVKRRECNIIYGKGSCGCNQTEHLKNVYAGNVNPDAGFKYVLDTYKKSAKDNNREFSLSNEIFKQLTTSKCFYCGVEPSKVKDGYGNIKYKNSVYIWNGMDRVDSTKGYTEENCVTCCTICNIAKKDMPYKEFLQLVKRIYNNLNDKNLME